MIYYRPSGKAVRLNGVNQYLYKDFTSNPITVSKYWCRFSGKLNVFPRWTNISLSHAIQNADELRITMSHDSWSGYVIIRIGTTTGTLVHDTKPYYNANYEETLGYGPVHVDVLWDGQYCIVYVNGTRVCKRPKAGDPMSFIKFTLGSYYSGGNYYKGDVGHHIFHNDIPDFFDGYPDHIPGAELTATEFLRVRGLTESDVLVLHDFREGNGKNYGFGGSVYDLNFINNPTVVDNEFQYELGMPLTVFMSLRCTSSPAQMETQPPSFWFDSVALGGSGSYTYTWQRSSDYGATWVNVAGQGASWQFQPMDAGEYWVKVVVDDGYTSTESRIVKVQVISKVSYIANVGVKARVRMLTKTRVKVRVL